MTIAPGLVLPELVIDVTPTLVITTAIATRDFQDVHHDRDRAVERGGKDIFLNILTTTGLVQRYVTDWAGPQALVRQIAIRLGVPCYAGDTLTFSGTVAGTVAGSSGDEHVLEVAGRCSLGDHVTGTVRVLLAPASQGAPSMYHRAGSGPTSGTSTAGGPGGTGPAGRGA
jgi:acyl dehydratase